MMELDDRIYAEVKKLSAEGNELFEQDRFEEAIEKFESAYHLLPEPRHQWEASSWIQAGAGDAYFFAGNYQEAYDHFSLALRSAGGMDTGFVWLRIGQSMFELKLDEKKTLDALLSAYMMEGEKIFDDEDEKYFNFLKENVDLRSK